MWARAWYADRSANPLNLRTLQCHRPYPARTGCERDDEDSARCRTVRRGTRSPSAQSRPDTLSLTKGTLPMSTLNRGDFDPRSPVGYSVPMVVEQTSTG